MKHSISVFLVLMLCALSASAQFDNATYIKFGWVKPIGKYGDVLHQVKDQNNGSHMGISFDYGKIYYWELSPINGTMNIGLNVDYISISSNYMRSEQEIAGEKRIYRDEEIRLGMKVGPVYTYNAARNLYIDAYAKLAPVIGFGFMKNEMAEYRSTDFGYGLRASVGAQVRFTIILVGLGFDIGDMRYFRDGVDGGIKEPRSTFNATIGICF